MDGDHEDDGNIDSNINDDDLMIMIGITGHNDDIDDDDQDDNDWSYW